MRPAMLPALPAFGEAAPAAVLPAWRRLLARTLAAGRAVLEVAAEARALRRALMQRYPFVDF
jgi:hypothetical protein